MVVNVPDVARTGVEQPGRPIVELDDVVAVIGAFPALAGASLTVERGEIVLLAGPNGAGKTTLLRLCGGLVPVVRGTATVLGHDLTTDRLSVRRHVGLLGHQNGLYSDLTVVENVEFWGATVGASASEIEAAMDRVGVGGRLRDVPTSRLSAGQKRRTALAALIARRAQLWLLDEPHAGLDADGRDELDATLRAAAESGATILVASHELERAGSLATRTVRVVGGQVLAETPSPNAPRASADIAPPTQPELGATDAVAAAAASRTEAIDARTAAEDTADEGNDTADEGNDTADATMTGTTT